MPQQCFAGRSSVGLPIKIRSGFYFYLAALIFLLPLPWVLAAVSAAFLHELGHLAGAAMAGLTVHSVSLDIGGARINTSPATDGQTLLTSVSGPAVGFLLCLSYPMFPRLAFCGFLQSIFNLMPIMPFDGGRVLLSLCNMLFRNNRGERVYYYLSAILMLIAGVFLYITFQSLWFALMLFVPTVLGMGYNKKILLANRL